MSRRAVTETTKVMLMMPKEGIWREISMGLVSIAAARGWQVELNYPMFHLEAQPQFTLDGVRRMDPDAIVISGEGSRFLKLPEFGGRLIVSAETDLTAQGVPSVTLDNAAIGREAANHLIRRGFRTFAAWGLGAERFAAERAVGFRGGVESAGLTFLTWPDKATVAPNSGMWMDHPHLWFDELRFPVGVFACCDSWGHQLLAICRDRNVRVPEDLAVVSVDNDRLICESSLPPMSSVIVPWQKLGNEVGLLIERLIDKGVTDAPERVMLGPVGTATRRSSDTTAASDPDVAEALSIIRRHADKPLSVPQILRKIPIYRQRLERKFRKTVGRSIMEEVRRVHVEQAKRLLATTDLSMPQVAERSGFPNSSKLAIAFRKEAQQTPTTYRRQFRPRQ